MGNRMANTIYSDDWLRAMDTEYHIKDGNSGLNCADIYTNHCPAPQGACNTWDHQPCEYTL